MYRTALRNVLAHKGRLLMTVLAVLLGTAFVAATLVFSDSVGQSLRDSMSTSFTGVSVQVPDVTADPGNGPKQQVAAPVPLTEAVLGAVRAVPDARSARGVVSGFAGLADPHGSLIGSRGSTLGANWVPGTIDLVYPDGTEAALTVGGVYQTSDLEGTSLLSESVLSRHTTRPDYTTVLVKGSGGATGQLRQALRDATGDNPLVQVQDHSDLQRSFSTRITLLLDIMYGLLGTAVVIAVLGVMNTLAMAVFERRREIGIPTRWAASAPCCPTAGWASTWSARCWSVCWPRCGRPGGRRHRGSSTASGHSDLPLTG
jgi:putative ABC transport system permease protein